MKRELGRTNEQGRLDRRTSVNSGKARQLGSYIAAELDIPGLRHLTDDEADKLVEHLNVLTEAAYFDGWQGAQEYNSDMARLTSAPLSTGH
jgi:hypothetical protein